MTGLLRSVTASLASSVVERLTDENVQDIVDTAASGGITYWAIEPSARELAGMPDDCQYVIVEGEDDRLFGFGGHRQVEEVHYLSRDQIRQAYAKVLDPAQGYANREYHGYVAQSWIDRTGGGIDTSMIDAGTADILVQVACFGEIRYG
ncbi:hypothetical protein [Streptomyces sp. NPDC047097]|uniref:hypothetical protein n=1 Tax=Streptomyces sp. NPDC047097 TaxID=3155260 RepID=UPI00340CC31D